MLHMYNCLPRNLFLFLRSSKVVSIISSIGKLQCLCCNKISKQLMHGNISYMFLMGHSWPHFLYFHRFNTDLIRLIEHLKFSDDWMWTADLWCWKRSLYQLSHNHYPIFRICLSVGLIQLFISFYWRASLPRWLWGKRYVYRNTTHD